MQAGPYQLGELLGRGAGGEVFRARGPEGTVVAVKRLRAREALRRFPRERLIQAELGREGGFVPIIDAGEDASGAWIAMPLLSGGTLRERLRTGFMSVEDIRELSLALADALGRAHARGFLHRDLKPENVLFDGEGQALIADLGIAKHLAGDGHLGLSRSLSATGEMRGTLGYLAPECVQDSKHADPRADVFSLGALLYECAAGRAPFQGATAIQVLGSLLEGKWAPLSRERSDLPRPVREVIERCMAGKPEARYPDGAAVAAALRAAFDAGAARGRARGLLRVSGVSLALGALGLAGVSLSLLGQRSAGEVASASLKPAPSEGVVRLNPLPLNDLGEFSGEETPQGEGGPVNRPLCLALTLFACTPIAAQEVRQPVRPQPVRVAEVGGNGHAETWDGRVFVITQGLPSGAIGWSARVLRPERIALDAEGRPRFDPGAFSPAFPLETQANAAAAGLAELNALAIVPWPGVAQNPYPSDAAGAAQPGGAYEAYDLLIATQRYAQGDDRLGRLRYRVVVRNPHTADAEVERAERLGNFQQFTQANGQPLRGIEPTATFDGHLLVWQGHPRNDSTIDALVYSYNQSSGAVGGWSPPRSLADMYPVDRATQVAGRRFDERFPLAERPLFASDGDDFARGQLIPGAYPWISRDGSELFFTSTVAGQVNVNRARRGGQAVIGRLTGWGVRHIDGPLNPDREASVRLFTSSPGLTPGFWTPFRDAPARIPAGAGQPIYPIFGSNTANYADVDLSDAADGEYTLVLRMNEVVDAGGRINAARTPDTSGRHRAGRLMGGAAFPQEIGLPDANAGHVGQTIYFPQQGSVRVPAPTYERGALTLSLWIKRLVSLDVDSANRYLLVANQPNAWNLVVEENGLIHATVRSGGAERRSGPLGPALPLNRWTHVTMSYEGSAGRLRVYLDGALAGEQTFGPGQIDASNAELVVGPGGQLPLAPGINSWEPVVLLDELTISRVERSAEEIAAAAFRPIATPAPSRSPGVALPLGIPAAALRVPATAVTSDAAAALGELLFFEPRISFDGSVSCASCHQPDKAFTDGLAVARGVRGGVGPRNTPTILNRALSMTQFFDGRAGSLEEQALAPIENALEMNLPLNEALARISSSPTYRARFQAAFGRGPDRATLAAALAAFQRRQLAGDSRVDRFEAGDANALTPEEVRGREVFQGAGRCTACHAGPNFSDEAFHATNLSSNQSDTGREQATGRAADRGRFKTPTLRAISRTAPYMHDGSVATLEDMIELYDRGGLRRDNRDPEMRALGLTAHQKADLAAFLRALEGPSTARPAPSLPSDVVFSVPAATPRELWVGRMYQALLGRAASPAEIAPRVAALATGTSPEDMARSVARSREALTHRVRGLYARYLGRGADAGGLASHLAAAQGGRSLERQELDFLLSGENAARRPGSTGWVTGLYEDVLRRSPDIGGFAHYQSYLQAMPGKRQEVAEAFLRSSERRGKWVDAVFTACAGRAPSAAERTRWVGQLDGGLALEELPVRVLGAIAP